MRAAAIDFGRTRVGLAVSDELGLLAHPRPALDGRNLGRLIKQLGRLAEEHGIHIFVVGLPLTLSGKEGSAAARVRRFAQRLEQETGLMVELMDERMTTLEARQRLRSSGLDERSMHQRVDAAAAAILLQTWLEQRQRSQT